MSRDQASLAELLLSLDSSDLQEAELVRAAVNQQLSSDRGGAVLSSLVDRYLDSSSSQAVLVLSSVREPHHKALLEKLNESLGRPGTRAAAVALLGHLIRKQPPWVHRVSRSPLLPSLLRCLKTDGDVAVLITGVLVLITLLPMIPQAGKQHIFDFFDVFGRLASWSYRNPGQVSPVHLVHLRAGVYSLFHRLYGMFPCNFISYLRLHYSMKENLDTFQEVVKPMLDHVRVHPELVTGTQDYELEPSRWRCYEVHDILIECSKVSLDPLESSCEEDTYSFSPRPPSASSSPPRLELPSTPGVTEAAASSGTSVCPVSSCSSSSPGLLLEASCVQLDDVTWSPSSLCGLSTPPPDPASSDSTPPLSTSNSGVRCPVSASPSGGAVAPPTESQVKQPITAQEKPHPTDAIIGADAKPQPRPLTSTPSRHQSICPGSTPAPACPLRRSVPPAPLDLPPTPAPRDPPPAGLDDSLLELALPRAASLFIGRKTQEALQRAAGGQEKEPQGQEGLSVSPLQALDQMILHGSSAHRGLSRRLSTGSKVPDRSQVGGKQLSVNPKGTCSHAPCSPDEPAVQQEPAGPGTPDQDPARVQGWQEVRLVPGSAQGEELQSLRSQLLLVHSQLQYERFKRQQHAVRNRRLLRGVINTAVLEEHVVAMRAQLGVQDGEIQCLRQSLTEEQRRGWEWWQEAQGHAHQLHTHTQHLQEELQEEQQENQRLQTELQQNQSRVWRLEAELQRASDAASRAEQQLTRLSVQLCSSQQLEEHICLLNQQLVLLRDANRVLKEQLQGGDAHSWTEACMLQSSLGRDLQRLKDSDVHLRQKLDAAHHKITDLENQLAEKDQLVQSQKKLLEDTKNQSRTELAASESRCVALRTLVQSLQTELLHLDGPAGAQDVDRPSSRAVSSPATQDKPRPSSPSAVGILNGAVEALSTPPLHLPSSSSSPLDFPLTVGSFLERQAKQLFGSISQRQEEEEQEEEQEEEEQEEQGQLETTPLGQEVEEATPLSVSPEALSHAAGDQRRQQLGIMDYDEPLPDF